MCTANRSIMLWTIVALVATQTAAARGPSQAAPVVAHTATVSAQEASITFETAAAATTTISLTQGRVVVNGVEAGSYRPGGPLHQAWQSVVRDASEVTSDHLLNALRALEVGGLNASERAALQRIGEAVRALEPMPARAPSAPVLARAGQSARSQEPAPALPGGPPGIGTVPRVPGVPELDRLQMERLLAQSNVYSGDVTIDADEMIEGSLTVLQGDVDVRGHVAGDLIALDGDVILRDGGVVDGDIHILNGELEQRGGAVHGVVRSYSGEIASRIHVAPEIAIQTDAPSFAGGVMIDVVRLVGAFVALTFIGFGLMIFAPRQLDVVADTAWHSFWRSFLAGLFAQPLLIPAFGMLIAGLVLTVVGILLVPFAVLAFLVAVFLAVVGGYIAVARTVGEVYLRRKMASGASVRGWLPYRYLLYGLLAVLSIWLPAVLLGWVPVAGTVLTVSAALLTWILATAGLGATIISRAGIRGTFVRRMDQALTDEHYWTASQPLPVAPREPYPRERS